MAWLRLNNLLLALAVLGVPIFAATARAEKQTSSLMGYVEARKFLEKHTSVVELSNKEGGSVLICPELQGRVMTSTCGGKKDNSFGWINRDFIEKGKQDAHFNNYGGEERFWLGPEGGQFSLWFAAGAKQNLDNWLTPPALNEGAFKLAVDGGETGVLHLARRIKLQNASKTQFDLDVQRNVRLLDATAFAGLFGDDAGKALQGGSLKMIGYETANTIINRGTPMTKKTGLVAIWSLGQFPPSPLTYIVVPYKAGDVSSLGPIVKGDYFGPVNKEYLQIESGSIRFRGDGNFRSKIGISQKRGEAVAGAIDYERGVLTLVHFTLPDDPTKLPYVNNAWDLPQKLPYVGDVFNSYNDGPPAPGKPALGGFYELESLSPADELATGKSLSHVKSTFHVEGDFASLMTLLEAALKVQAPGMVWTVD